MNQELYKSKLLNLLIEFDKVCNQYQLRYFLIGGSMLGAVRHHGIIPWDDDIDVAMPRPDLEKLKSISSHVFSDNCELVDYHTKGYPYRFCKLMDKNTTVVESEYNFFIGGVWIDVFAFDGLPGSKEEAENYYHTAYAPNWYRLYSLCSPVKIVLNKGLRSFIVSLRSLWRHMIYTIPDLICKLEKAAMKYDYDTAEWIINFQGGYGLREMMRRDYFDEYILADFEGGKFRIPKQYDAYLTWIYGDYMTPPPVDKRVSNHKLFFVDLDKRMSKDEILSILNRLDKNG